MKLAHYSKLHKMVPVSRQQSHYPNMKPNGLWVSDDDANYIWPDVVLDKKLSTKHLAYRHRVMLSKGARIKYIHTPEQLDEFTVAFEAGLPWNGKTSFAMMWNLIAERYQGIVITPYIELRRYHQMTNWYWPWDCASGCIWDVDAIDFFQTIGDPVGQIGDLLDKTKESVAQSA